MAPALPTPPKIEKKPKEKKGQSRRFLDLFFYTRYSSSHEHSGQTYVADKHPEFDARKGLRVADESAFEHDICENGLASFGLGLKDVKEPFGVVIRAKICIMAIEKGGFANVITQKEFAKAEDLAGPPNRVLQRKGMAQRDDEDKDNDD